MTDGPQNDLGWSPEQWEEVGQVVGQNLQEQGWTPPAGWSPNPRQSTTYIGGGGDTETGILRNDINIGKVEPIPGQPMPPSSLIDIKVDPNFIKKIQARDVALDPKLATKLLNIPRGTQFGPTDDEREYLKSYITSARMRTDLRTVLAAIKEGYSQIEDISSVTGLDNDQVGNALRQLLAKGLIKSTV